MRLSIFSPPTLLFTDEENWELPREEIPTYFSEKTEGTIEVLIFIYF